MVITVPTISCDACVNTLTKAIQKLDADAVVTGDAAAKTLSIQSSVSEADIKAAIVNVGHEYA
ncbi:MAG: cation transporter [Cyanobacteria bacterium P01_F01_bin.42]